MTPLFHLLFLVLLALCATLFLLWRSRGKGLGGWGLGGLFALALIGLFLHQAGWQLSGFGDLDFQKFQRRYDTRPATLSRTSDQRGKLLDRHGNILAQSLPKQRWGHKTALGEAGLHVIGYSSREYGLSGLERVYDARLCGLSPVTETQDLLKRTEPEDIRTTLDATLQRTAFKALAGRRGAVIALDPRTGEVLALVSSPSSDESRLREAMNNRTDTPLFNRATHGLYPPGSVFKLFTAALAMDCKRAGDYACPPEGWMPARDTAPIRDTHPRPKRSPNHSLRTAFSESSNIWFAKAAVACGWKAFADAAQRCALTEGFTLASCGDRSYGTVAAQLPDLADTPIRLAYVGFGQGDLLVTPMHIAALTSAVANKGVLLPPHLEKGIKVTPRRFFSTSTASRVNTLMQASVSEGTSRKVALRGLSIAGKTGTAENPGNDHAWFTCFAPADNPEIVVTVLVENGGYGASTALPIAKTLLETWRRNRPSRK